MAATPSTRNGKFIEELYNAFNSGDDGTVLDGLAPDVTWIELDGHPFSGVHYGPDEVLENVFDPIDVYFESLVVRPERYIESDGFVIVEGDVAVISKQGTESMIPFAHVCEIERSRLSRLTSYIDTALLAQAVDN